MAGDITSKFGKMKDEIGTYNLTEGICFGEQSKFINDIFSKLFVTF